MTAQTNAELAARDAFLVSPTALPPFLSATETQRAIVGRVGVWKLYQTDPLRANVGLTVVRPWRADWRSSYTLIYLSAPCAGCDSWLTGAVDVEQPMTSHMDLRLTLGLGHPIDWSSASSASMGASVPAQLHWRFLAASVQPGVMLAAIAGERTRVRSLRGTLGTAIAVSFGSWRLQAGIQAVALHGSAPVFGGALSRAMGARS